MMWFTRVSSQASVANGLALALEFYYAPLADGLWRSAIVTVLTTVLTGINLVGVKQSSWVVNALTIGKLVPLALFIVTGIWFIQPSHWSSMPAVTPQQAGAAALLLIFAYGGYEVTGVLAGEAANPKRDVPFAFVMTKCLPIGRQPCETTARTSTGPSRITPTAPPVSVVSCA